MEHLKRIVVSLPHVRTQDLEPIRAPVTRDILEMEKLAKVICHIVVKNRPCVFSAKGKVIFLDLI